MIGKVIAAFRETVIDGEACSSLRPKVTMVGWSGDDHFVFTAASDFSVKVWDSACGTLRLNLMVRDTRHVC